MKRTLKLALTAVLGAMLAVPALAQDNFPDVPDNHWAYEALLRMKSNGLLVGYPDGLFRGNRPASRYEMAVAIHATYVNLKNITDGLQAQIDELKRQMQGAGGGDSANLRAALERLQNDVNGMRRYGDDIANLRRLAETFQKELADLNVDVEQIKKDLADLDRRVKVLEGIKPAVSISGDINLWVASGNSRDFIPGLDKDGRLNGATISPGGRLLPLGIPGDLTVLHEAAITLKSTAETGPQFRGTFVFGNMLGNGGFGTQADSGLTGLPYSEGEQDMYIQELVVSLGEQGRGLSAEVGRFGYKISPYIFQRPDFTTYFSNERWDNGKYTIDGAHVNFGLGTVNIGVFGGKPTNASTVNGNALQPLFIAPFPDATTNFNVDRTLGVTAGVNLGDNGGLNLAYLFLDSDTGYRIGSGSTRVENNRIAVFGADANFKFGPVNVAGGWSQSDLLQYSEKVNTRNNQAWYAQAGVQLGPVTIGGGYREIDPRYLAPGDWGRLGVTMNPTNIKGFMANASIRLGDAFTLYGSGEFDEGKSNVDGFDSPFNTDTKIDKFTVGLKYRVTSALTFMAEYEDTKFKNLNILQRPSGYEPHYKWTTIGLGYALGNRTTLSLAYEISDHKDEYVTGASKYTGGLLTTQLSVKF
jgi:predicted porin/uncharacterized protein YukE